MSRFVTRNLRLGIDTGGTYTDVAIIDASDRVVTFGKVLTTQYDLAVGIDEALSQLPLTMISRINLVSLSTTLATNAVVEGRGAPVGLLLAGYKTPQVEKSGIETAVRNGQYVLLEGGHDAIGDEKTPLDLKNAIKALQSWRTKVSAIGISGVFSVRNPAHEIALRELATTYTNLPITCGHELASLLDAPRRAVTVAINASLIPFISELITSVQEILAERRIIAPLMIVKGDGSLVKADIALHRPVETVISGPAASVVGACHLSQARNSIVADMGGTTTDISIVNEGRLNISEQETLIGDWRPMVEAIKIVSVGLGGDSEARFKGGYGLTLGPHRVIPMSLLGHRYPNVLELLNVQLSHSATARSNRFALRLNTDPIQLEHFSAIEREVWDMLAEGPLEMKMLSLKFREQAKAVSTLKRKGAIIYSGFTPSDAAHVLAYTNHWSHDTANIAAKIWIKQMRDVYGWGNFDSNDTKGASQVIHDAVIREITQTLIRATLTVDNQYWSSIEMATISKILTTWITGGKEEHPKMFSLKFHNDISLVAVGAPAHLYYPEVSKNLGISYEVPSNAQVANAVGAVVGGIVQRARITVTQPTLGLYRVHDNTGPADFFDLKEAITFAKTITEERAKLKAEKAGAENIEVSTVERRTSVDPDKASEELFFESVITATASGRPFFTNSQ
jgi:N-methylhydantoinase A/oxoprolinase/acetone carboxylase beta subunit